MVRKARLGVVAVVWAMAVATTGASAETCQPPPCSADLANAGTTVTVGTVSMTPPAGVQPADHQDVIRRGTVSGAGGAVAGLGVTVLLSVLTVVIRRRRRWIGERPQVAAQRVPAPVPSPTGSGRS